MRLPILASLLIPLTACTTVVPVSGPRDYISASHPSRVWVKRNDNRVMMVEAPRLLGDTLTGFVDGVYQETLLSDVREVSTRRPAPRRTVFLVGGMVVVGAAAFAVLSASGPGGGYPTGEDPSVPGGRRARP
jgi:hypothetical protein